MLPLRGLRVVDASIGIAGGYAARLLSGAGAEVVKVEDLIGDPLRHRSAVELPVGATVPLFEHLHDGHESIVVDRGSQTDRRRLASLLASADIVLLGRDDSSAARPAFEGEWFAVPSSAVTVEVSPFGSTGPWTDRAANEFTLQAWSGKLSQSYSVGAGRAPVAAGGETGLWLAGAFAALGALACQRHVARTGEGMHVDLSILECMVAVFGSDAIARQLGDGRVAAAPSVREVPAIHAAADGLVAFAIVTAQQWADFCVMIEKFEWAEDRELATSIGRRRRTAEVAAAVDEWLVRHSTDEVMERAALLRVPVGVVANGATAPTLGCYDGTFSTGAAGFVQPRVPLRFSDLGPPPAPTADERVAQERDTRDARPLADLRIADFTAFWAGPYAACLLALLGADVIHVESAKRPDGMRMRSARPPSDATWLEWSAIFHLNNASKRSICIDMDQPEGLDLAHRLIRASDCVIENFSPRVMERFGLDRQGMARLHPDTVYVRMPAFGLDNPWRDRPAFQHTIEPLAGLAWISGYPDADPLPIMVCDALGGVHAAFALLCGIRQRERTGAGVHVEVRLSEVAAAIAAEQSVTASATGVVLRRIGNRHRRCGPQGVYACARRDDALSWIAISIDTDDQWRSLRALVAARRPDDAGTLDAFDTLDARRAAADEIDDALARWCAGLEIADVASLLERAGIPYAIVAAGSELLANEQLAARSFFTRLVHPVCGELAYPGLPMQITRRATRVPCDPRSAAPLLGEHDGLVESLLGVTADEARRLRDLGVTGARTTANTPM